MSKTEKILQAYFDIATAANIATATLETIIASAEENDSTQYIVMGALQQIDNIQQSLTELDNAMKGDVA